MKEFIFASLILLMASTPVNANDAYPGKIREAIYSSIAKPLKKHMKCLTIAADAFDVNEFIVLSVLLVEAGYQSPVRKNNDGTFDHGLGQINTVRESEIAKIGLSLKDVESDPCKNIIGTSYLLKTEIEEAKDISIGIGNYHYDLKGKWPHNHYSYRQRVFNKYLHIISIAKKHI